MNNITKSVETLAEYCRGKGYEPPVYTILSRSPYYTPTKPPVYIEKMYTSQVSVNGVVLAQGKGVSKRLAHQKAAADGLHQIRLLELHSFWTFCANNQKRLALAGNSGAKVMLVSNHDQRSVPLLLEGPVRNSRGKNKKSGFSSSAAIAVGVASAAALSSRPKSQSKPEAKSQSLLHVPSNASSETSLLQIGLNRLRQCAQDDEKREETNENEEEIKRDILVESCANWLEHSWVGHDSKETNRYEEQIEEHSFHFGESIELREEILSLAEAVSRWDTDDNEEENFVQN